jgi:hypothetical protein
MAISGFPKVDSSLIQQSKHHNTKSSTLNVKWTREVMDLGQTNIGRTVSKISTFDLTLIS